MARVIPETSMRARFRAMGTTPGGCASSGDRCQTCLTSSSHPYCLWCCLILLVIGSAIKLDLARLCLRPVDASDTEDVRSRCLPDDDSGTPFAQRRSTPGAAAERRKKHKFNGSARHARVGCLLRRSCSTKCRNLNVLLGDMVALSGPVRAAGNCRGYASWQHACHAVVPGITLVVNRSTGSDRCMRTPELTCSYVQVKPSLGLTCSFFCARLALLSVGARGVLTTPVRPKSEYYTVRYRNAAGPGRQCATLEQIGNGNAQYQPRVRAGCRT